MKPENTKKNQEEKDFMRTVERIGVWKRYPKSYVLNLEKEKKVYEVQQKMQEILDEEDIQTKVKIKPCPLGMGDVVVEFESDSITVRNIKKIQGVIKEMSNFEIYPTKEGVKFAGIIPDVYKVILR